MNARCTDVLLIETPFFSDTGTDEVRAYVQSKYNLALLALGSYVRQRSRYTVRVVNMVKNHITGEQLLELMRGDRPKVVGMPLYSYNLGISYRLITAIKRAFPDVHVTVGGPHAQIFPRETIALDGIDSMVLGDGEYPFLGICERVIGRGELNPDTLPPGTYTKRHLQGAACFEAYAHHDLNELPIPDLTLLDNHREYKDFLSNKVMGILTTSRGCPFVCHFCWSEKSRYRSVAIEKIIDTMRYYKSMGVEYIEFWDETFNATRRRFEDFADAMAEARLGLTWSIRGAVVHQVDGEILAKLKRSGLRIMQFGVESTNSRVLEAMNKKMNRNRIENALRVCRDAGVRSVANMIIGYPGQTREEIVEDLLTIRRYGPTYVSVSIYNYAPGTTDYERALENGTLEEDFWRRHAANPAMKDPVTHARCEVEASELYRIRARFIFRFYFSWRYLARYLRLVDTSEIVRAVSIGFMMLRYAFRNGVWPRIKPTFQ